ncbi:MAG: PAS domain-containing protein [Amphiplicatus sp.]
MNESVVVLKKVLTSESVEAAAILNTLPSAVVVLREDNTITYLNSMGEQFFRSSASQLKGQALTSLVPADSPLFGLIEQVRTHSHEVVDYGVLLESPRRSTASSRIAARHARLPPCRRSWRTKSRIRSRVSAARRSFSNNPSTPTTNN